MTELEVFSIAK